MPLELDVQSDVVEWDTFLDPSGGLDNAMEMTVDDPCTQDAYLQTLWEPRSSSSSSTSSLSPTLTTSSSSSSSSWSNTASPTAQNMHIMRSRKTSLKSVSCDAKLQALEAQLQNLDPTSKEAKKQRRLIRNRMSAQLHRERKKAYVDQLEGELHEKQVEIARLQAQVVQLQQADKGDDVLDGFLDPTMWLEAPNIPTITSKIARWITVVLSMTFFSNEFSHLEQVLEDPVRTKVTLDPIVCTEGIEWHGVADQVQVLAQENVSANSVQDSELFTGEDVQGWLQDPQLRQSLQGQTRLTSTLSTMPSSRSLLQFSWPLPSDRIITFQTTRPTTVSSSPSS